MATPKLRARETWPVLTSPSSISLAIITYSVDSTLHLRFWSVPNTYSQMLFDSKLSTVLKEKLYRELQPNEGPLIKHPNQLIKELE